jgi:FkbM family methyltransferase
VPEPSVPVLNARRLLKRLYRYRQAVKRRGLTRLFARQHKAALLAEFTRDWPGGYVLTDSGDFAFIPAPIDSQCARVLFQGLLAHEAALALAPRDGVAIDVGANLGEWTVPLARSVGPAGQVIALDPNPAMAAALDATLRINRLSQASALQLALSDHDGEGRFSLDLARTELAHLTSDGSGVAVTLRRLDTIVAEAGLRRLDLVKIDVEGHEAEVLAGGVETLRRFRPAVIFESGMETPESRAAIVRLFDEVGYDIVADLQTYGCLVYSTEEYRRDAGLGSRGICNLLALNARLDLSQQLAAAPDRPRLSITLARSRKWPHQ